MTSPPAWMQSVAAQTLLAAFARHGQALRFVGGCVRDTLMGRAVGDIDAATPARPEAVLALLEAEGIRALPTGLAHGTVTALVAQHPVEITTLREDAACDGRHAEVRFTDDWKQDAARRDFTMNALYMDAAGTIYDYVDGQEDVAAQRVRFIGDPVARIREDYLRILRFFRFFATHGAPPVDEAGLRACAQEAPGLEHLSGERIRGEMFKLLAAADPVPALKLMDAHAILPHLGLDAAVDWSVFSLPVPPDPLLRLMLWSAGRCDSAALAARWRLSNQERDRLQVAYQAPFSEKLDEAEAKQHLRREGEIHFRDRMWHWWATHPQEAQKAQTLLTLPERWSIPVFPVSGKDLLALGMKPGEAMGKMLQELEAKWEASDYTLEKDTLLQCLKAQ